MTITARTGEAYIIVESLSGSDFLLTFREAEELQAQLATAISLLKEKERQHAKDKDKSKESTNTGIFSN